VAPQPSIISGVEMKPYQLQALDWMLTRESSSPLNSNSNSTDSNCISAKNSNESLSSSKMQHVYDPTCPMEGFILNNNLSASQQTVLHPLWQPITLTYIKDTEILHELFPVLTDKAIVIWWDKFSHAFRLIPPDPLMPCKGGILADEM
jgi:hypothetical protein